MQKDFDKWNEIKKKTDAKIIKPNCKKGEIWWCVIGKNIGVEQGCKSGLFNRPVLVIRVFNSKMFWGIPITSSDEKSKKENSKYYYNLQSVRKIKGFASLSQMRLFDNKRLIRKITKIEREIIEDIKYRIKNIF
jgi:mRNA interferase MazF